MKKSSMILLLIILGGSLLLPLFLTKYVIYILAMACISVITATGLNLVTGYTGRINLGQSGFIAIGAYATTILMTRAGISFWAALPAGAIISTFVGILIGLPILRLRGIYFALVTFGFASIIEMVLVHWVSLTRGPDGLPVPSPQLGSFSLDSDLRMFYPIFIITVAMVYLAKNIINSRVGRAWIAIRDSEIIAKAMGVNISVYATIAFALSAFYGGIAGGLYACLVLFISPDAFEALTSVIYLTMIVVGGMGSILGSVIGGALLSLLPEFLRGVKHFQELLFGSILILSLIFLPNGIAGLFGKFRTVFDKWMKQNEESS